MDELSLKIAGVGIQDIIQKPNDFPEEVVAVSLDAIRRIRSKLYEPQVLLENNLITRMEKDNSTKLLLKDGDNERVGTLKSGKMECKEKDVDITYKDAGFDPLEIGKYIFKPEWSKAKEARKYGGSKKEIIEKVFKEGKKSIEIK